MWLIRLLLAKATGNIAFFDSFAFIVFLLAFSCGDDEFNVTASCQDSYWYKLQTVLTGASKTDELFFSDKELYVTYGIGIEGEVIEP